MRVPELLPVDRDRLLPSRVLLLIAATLRSFHGLRHKHQNALWGRDMAVNPVKRIRVHLDVVDAVPEHIGCVGAEHFSTFVEHFFFAIRAPFVVAIARTTMNVDAQP